MVDIFDRFEAKGYASCWGCGFDYILVHGEKHAQKMIMDVQISDQTFDKICPACMEEAIMQGLIKDPDG